MAAQPDSRKLLYLCYAGFTAIAIPSGALNVAWVHIEADFGLTLSALGVLLTTQSVGRLLISFYNGAILSRIGVGLFLLLGNIATAIGLIGFVLAPSWGILVLAGIVMSFGGSAIINGINTFVASNYGSSHMNWLHASFGLGMAIGPLVVTTVVIDMGLAWQWSYTVMLGAPLVMTLLYVATREEWDSMPGLEDDDNPAEENSGSMRATLQNPVVWLGIAIFFFATGNEINTGQLTNSLFVVGRGFDAKTVSTWLSLYWMMFTIGRLTTGIIIDQIDHDLFLRVNMLGTIVGAILIGANLGQFVSFAGLIIMGFTLAPTAPTLFSDTPRRLNKKQAANAIGFQNFGVGLGIALPPALAGVLAETLGLEIIGPFMVVIAISTFILHEFLAHYNQQAQKRNQGM